MNMQGSSNWSISSVPGKAQIGFLTRDDRVFLNNSDAIPNTKFSLACGQDEMSSSLQGCADNNSRNDVPGWQVYVRFCIDAFLNGLRVHDDERGRVKTQVGVMLSPQKAAFRYLWMTS